MVLTERTTKLRHLLTACPEPITEDGKITNAEQLRRYWRDRHEREDISRHITMTLLRDTEQKSADDRLNNLEAMTAEPGSVPRQYEDMIFQLQAHINHLEKRLNEKKKWSEKVEYKGIEL